MQLGFVVSNAAEKMEIAVCNEPGSERNCVKVRTTYQGVWSPWVRIDAQRTSNGDLDVSVSEAGTARTASRWTSPLTLKLTGDVSGSVTFNGSEGSVECVVSADMENSDQTAQATMEDIARRIAGELVSEHERRYDHYNTNTGN